jgi:hypothetical protein
MADSHHTEPAPTLEEIWRLFRETDRQMKQTDLKFQETDRQFKETDRQFKETARRFKETDRRFKETDRRFKETDRQFKETDLKFQETDRKISRLASQLGSHGDRLGEFVQEMVRPGVVRLFRGRGLPVHQVMPNVTAYDDDGRYLMEIDLLVINASTIIAVECKSRCSVDDVDEHLERLERFKACFPPYQAYTLMGAMAAMVMPDDVARYAYRRGLFVLAQSGDALALLNDGKFSPATW